jgi:hypothetical protein
MVGAAAARAVGSKEMASPATHPAAMVMVAVSSVFSSKSVTLSSASSASEPPPDTAEKTGAHKGHPPAIASNVRASKISSGAWLKGALVGVTDALAEEEVLGVCVRVASADARTAAVTEEFTDAEGRAETDAQAERVDERNDVADCSEDVDRLGLAVTDTVVVMLVEGVVLPDKEEVRDTDRAAVGDG